MNVRKALAKLYKAIVGSDTSPVSAAKMIAGIADNWATAVPAASFKQGAYVADAASTPTKAEFNALVKSLKDAGIISSTAPS